MAKKEDVAYKEFVEEVLGKLPEDKRKVVQEQLLADESIGREIFRGGLREEEFHRRLTEQDKAAKAFQAEKEAMQKWYNDTLPVHESLKAEREELLKQLKAAKRQLEDAGVDPKDYGIEVPTKRDSVTDLGAGNAALQEQLNRVGFLVDRALPRLLADVLKVQAKAIKENWSVDASDVLDEALKTGVTPEIAFERLTAKERDERRGKELEDLKKKWIEEGRREAMKDRASSPDRIPAAGPSIFDTLTKDKTSEASTKAARIDGAVAAFLENPGRPGDSIVASGF